MYESEIRKGIALLDQTTPGWRGRVRVDQLDMSFGGIDENGCGCVCAMTYGSFEAGITALTGYLIGREIGITGAYEWAAEHGFMAAGPDGDPDGDYVQLTREWQHALRGLDAARGEGVPA